LATSFS